MPKEEWGVKRVCPTTGKRFYDLNKDPIVSPYTGEVATLDTGKGSRSLVAEKPSAASAAKSKAHADDEVVLDDEDELVLDDDSDLDDDLLEDDDDDNVSLDDIADVGSDDDE